MRLYFTTDVHGSTLCFKKFLKAGQVYSSDVAILGGDITGKLIIPITEKPDGTYYCQHQGTVYELKNKEEADKLQKKIEEQGYYAFIMPEKEMAEYGNDQAEVDQLFTKLIVKRVEEWIELADERLRDQKSIVYVQPGNDDRYDIDPIIAKSKTITNPDGKVVQLSKDHEMISTGHANITPWRCPRDETEEKLAEIIEGMASQVKNMENCVFNFHCPPYDTYLDLGPKLDATLKPEMAMGGGVKMIPVGSVAIRKAIDKYQPLLGLHGHIHESKAVQKLGRTTILNPGSEYGEGILRGALLDLDKKGVKNVMFVQG